MSNDDTLQTNSGPIVDSSKILPSRTYTTLEERKETIVGDELSQKQEMFCQYYTGPEKTFGNGVYSYAEAYGYDLESLSSSNAIFDPVTLRVITPSDHDRAYNVCGAASWRLLKNVKINNRIIKLLNESMTNESVDAELIKIIKHAPKPSDRISAIREFNALNQRITKKLDLTTKGESLNIEDRIKINSAIDDLL